MKKSENDKIISEFQNFGKLKKLNELTEKLKNENSELEARINLLLDEIFYLRKQHQINELSGA